MVFRFSVSTIILLMYLIPVYAESHHPEEFLKTISGTKNEGMQIYIHFCVNCHAQKPLISLGAPRIGEENDWKLRLKQGRHVLFQHTDEGLNGMPPRGGCFECTDRQLMLAIVTMLPQKILNTLKDN